MKPSDIPCIGDHPNWQPCPGCFERERLWKEASDPATLRAKLKILQDEVDDWRECHRQTVVEACNPRAYDDRTHCTYVPDLQRAVTRAHELLGRLLDAGQWFHSAIELNPFASSAEDGEKLKAEIEALLGRKKVQDE